MLNLQVENIVNSVIDYKVRKLLYIFNFAIIACFALFSTACNEKSDEPSAENYTSTPSVAVNSFSLQADSKVMANLDSVHFSIDLEHGVIFNADSLPLGTDVTKLVANISFPSSVSSAYIEMSGGKVREGIIDYKTNSLDSLDFSGSVLLRLSDGENLSKNYQLKVNVHKSVPDSIIWDKLAQRPFPSRLGYPRNQKTISWKNSILSVIEENDGSFSMSKTENPLEEYDISPIFLPFTPRLRTLTAGGENLYILAADGGVWRSQDAISWTPMSEKWDNIIGVYGDTLLGLRNDNGNYRHVSLNTSTGNFEEGEPIESGFPIKDYSNFAIFSSEWSDMATGFFAGGIDAGGQTVAQTWAYDGTNWTTISNSSLPQLSGPTLIPYYIYRRTSSDFVRTEFSVWLAIGGRNADGSPNRTVYLSYDTGVNWSKAPMLMQLPDFVPSLYMADAVIRNFEKSYNLSQAWKARHVGRPAISRISYEIEGTDVSWECPYIFLYGGMDENNQLSGSIWRAVLARLSFPPLF